MARIVFWIATLLAAGTSGSAFASFHLFQIEELYSNADGTVQYVVLHEFAGANGENFLAGQRLTATHGNVSKTFIFPANLPSSATAGKRALIATQGFAALGLVTPDYIIPDRFLPTDGGTLDYASVDHVNFIALPDDGTSAYLRNNTLAPNVATNFAGASASVPAATVTAVEFFNQALDHYFVSALAPDIDALDSGRISGWVRTGQTFKVYPSLASGGAGNVNPVCRFYIPPEHGNSHFFTASPVECDAVNQSINTDPNYSGYTFESPNAFFIALPDTTTGACPANTVPVYRLWNQRADSNHRYTTSPAIKAQMIAAGYAAEGYGPDAVIMCAPM